MLITANEIREVRNFLRLSQKDFAERFGWKQQTVANWELGIAHPRFERLVKLSSLYEEMQKQRRRKPRAG